MSWPADPSSNFSHSIQRGKLHIDLVRERITFDDQPLAFNPTEFALLAYLAQSAPRVVPFVELAQQIPGCTSESAEEANEALRYHIYRLRRTFSEAVGDAEIVQTVRNVGYVLNRLPQEHQPSGLITFLFSDIEGSTQLWEQHSQAMKAALQRHDTLLRQAFEAYGGYVFKTVGDGFYVAFSQATSALAAALAAQRTINGKDWEKLTRLRVRMALSTGEAEEREGDYYGPTLNLAARLLSAGHGGQILLCEATHAALATHLPSSVELRDMGPRRFKGMSERQRVFQALAPDLPGSFPPLRTLDPRPTNLPAALTSFIGREDALQAVRALLRSDTARLVTLTGPGGIGKTRLSLQVAASLRDEYEHGVFFVPLGTIQDVSLVPSSVAHAVGANKAGDDVQIDQLIAYLASRQLLLVVDNFEHLMEAAPLVNDLLRGAPNLKVLVTSREELQIYGEHLYVVAPLAFPQPHTQIVPAQLDDYPATALFVQRMQSGLPHLTLTAQDATIISAICTTLDGIPLAIELATARTAQFTLAELAERLTHRLEFLNTGPRDLPARQRTLRGALDWSYQLLTRPEQTLFAYLSVCVGGWTETTAHRLVAGSITPHTQITDTLTSLVAKSLIQCHFGQTARFTMLETIREYAREHLQHSGEFAAMLQAHAATYRELLAGLRADLTGEAQAAAYNELKNEEDNLRAAMAWSLQQEGDETALEMCGILWRWWAARSYLREGRAWLKQALAQQTSAQPALRAAALWGAGRLAFFQADYNAAEDLLRQSLALYRELGDRNGIAWVLDAIGAVFAQRQEFAHARQMFEESLDLHRVEDNRRGISHTIDDLGQVAFLQGDVALAGQLFAESLQLRRQSGSPEGTAVALVNLSEAVAFLGDYQQAEILLQEGLQIYRQLNQPSGVILCLSNLGQFKAQQGDFQGALTCYTQSLRFLDAVEEEESELVVESLIGLAASLKELGRDNEATQVLGVVATQLDNLDTNAAQRGEYDRLCEATRAQLDRLTWTRAWDDGQAMSLTEIMRSISHQEDAV